MAGGEYQVVRGCKFGDSRGDRGSVRFSVAAGCLSALVLFFASFAQAYSWGEGELIPVEGMPNPYQFSDADWEVRQREGLEHALVWPVSVTGALIPYRATTPYIHRVVKWLNLYPFPENQGAIKFEDRWQGSFSPYFIPYPRGETPEHPMGFTVMERGGVQGYTFACAACHTGQIFGRAVMGMTNRFPGANETFRRGKLITRLMLPGVFQFFTGATHDEKEMYKNLRENLRFVDAKKPIALSLDTSLAHTALSLARRAADGWAEKDPHFAKHPRAERLKTVVAESKPAVWWNVKYKNKWLLDGSVVSGNPVLTNFIWNEIGRGVDLHELNDWLAENRRIVDSLTTAVYNAQAPRMTDFFGPEKFSLARAQEGEKLFLNRCAGCHGVYLKKWSEAGSESLPLVEQLATTKVIYFADTLVRDVGTDPQRREGMASLLQLNNLEISKNLGIKVKVQNGYVPPPLVGIWARFPYLHNNSIPSLCQLLTPAAQRVKGYYSGEPRDPVRDFDFECNGYPLGERAPQEWRQSDRHHFDTNLEGLSNQGHERGLEGLTDADRRALIHFLQTL